MKLILSRKGFDSAAGGVASPILPSGHLCWLPIPTPPYGSRYADIRCIEGHLGQVVAALTGGRIAPEDPAHLDPDLWPNSIPREPGWRALFGQAGAAQGHLQAQGVGEGDLFLFYGWFRQVEWAEGSYRYVAAAPDVHLLYGWLQVGQVLPADDRDAAPAWARYHPHFHYSHARINNVVYVAAERLHLPGCAADLPGAGMFERFHPSLCLTAPGHSRSIWQLPSWFNPAGRRSALSYHGRPERWTPQGEHVLLECVGRGQEFVLNCDDYPEAFAWLASTLPLAVG